MENDNDRRRDRDRSPRRSRSPRRDRSRSPRRDRGDRGSNRGGYRSRGGSRGGGSRGGGGSRRGPITCYGCQQIGHHIRDCPSKPNDNRGGSRGGSRGGFSNRFSRKRGREDDEQPEVDEDDEIESRLKSLLVRIGDKTQSSVEKNIDLLASALEEDVLAHHKFILDILFKCVVGLPAKGSVYATLIGLMNEANSQFGVDCVKEAQITLFKALQDNDHDRVRLLVRFIGCLVNAHVIQPQSFTTLLSDLLKCIDEEKLEGNTADMVLYDVMFGLPWFGEVLSQSVGTEFTAIINTIDGIMENRGDAVNVITNITTTPSKKIRCDDLLSGYWKAVKQLESSEWKTGTVPTPHKHFEDRLLVTTAHDFEMDIVPTQAVTVPYQLRTDLRLYDPALGIGKDISEIDRLITSNCISDTMLTFQAMSTEATKQLLGIPVEFEYYHLIVETLLALAFQLPAPRQKIVYYFGIFVNMFKAQPKKMPPLVGRAMNSIFLSLDILDVEIRDRFSQWFSFHLSNFGYQWPWKNWAFVNTLPVSHPQRIFMQDTLRRCVRLSFWEKVKETLPDEIAALLPAKPQPNFRYSAKKPNNDQKKEEGKNDGEEKEEKEEKAEEDSNKVEIELSSELMKMFREKKTSEELVQWFDETVVKKLGDDAKLDIFVPTLLMAGSKTYSHAFAYIERYGAVFTKFASNTPQNQAKIVDLVGEFWQDSSQHAMIVLDKLGNARVVNAPSIIAWCFRQKENWIRPWLWDLLQLIVDKTLSSINKIIEKLTEKEKALTETGDAQQLEPVKHKLNMLTKQKKDMFVMVIKNFITALSKQPDEEEKEIDAVLKQRLRQFHRKFDSSLAQVVEDIKKEAFGEKDEELLEFFNATHSQLQTLRLRTIE